MIFPLATGGYIPHSAPMENTIAPHMADLLSEIESAISTGGITERDIGLRTMNDHKLVSDIRSGRELRHSSRQRVRTELAVMAKEVQQDTAA